MKTVSAFVGAVVLMLMLAMPVMAGQCPTISKQIDSKIAAMNVSGDKLSQVKALQAKGMEQHRSGQHAESVETLKQALAMLAG